eukprot:gene27-83_t
MGASEWLGVLGQNPDCERRQERPERKPAANVPSGRPVVRSGEMTSGGTPGAAKKLGGDESLDGLRYLYSEPFGDIVGGAPCCPYFEPGPSERSQNESTTTTNKFPIRRVVLRSVGVAVAGCVFVTTWWSFGRSGGTPFAVISGVSGLLAVYMIAFPYWLLRAGFRGDYRQRSKKSRVSVCNYRKARHCRRAGTADGPQKNVSWEESADGLERSVIEGSTPSWGRRVVELLVAFVLGLIVARLSLLVSGESGVTGRFRPEEEQKVIVYVSINALMALYYGTTRLNGRITFSLAHAKLFFGGCCIFTLSALHELLLRNFLPLRIALLQRLGASKEQIAAAIPCRRLRPSGIDISEDDVDRHYHGGFDLTGVSDFFFISLVTCVTFPAFIKLSHLLYFGHISSSHEVFDFGAYPIRGRQGWCHDIVLAVVGAGKTCGRLIVVRGIVIYHGNWALAILMILKDLFYLDLNFVRKCDPGNQILTLAAFSRFR